jgi:microcystin degradation protein MlrC
MNSSRPHLRLAIAGIHIESSTFSPLRSQREDFIPLEGAAMLSRYPFLAGPDFAEIEPAPLAHFRALPGGMIRRECYDAMKGRIVRLAAEAGPVDALYFDVHGAMAVEGLDDAEADLLAALRHAVGGHLPVTCSQDLHGNVSPVLAAMTDIITTYRTAPHRDWLETRERAVRLLLRWRAQGGQLHRAHVSIPVLVSGEMSSTESEPGRSLYAPIPAMAEQPGVWDASLWVGYAWADQARSMATAMALGPDAEAVGTVARELGQRYWKARHDFRFIAPAGSAEWCLDAALKLDSRAVFLSDAGDNPTAGGAGDVTATLGTLLAHPAFGPTGPATAIFASIPDAEAVAACMAAGTGQSVSLAVGGKLDPVHGKPLGLTGTVQAIKEEGDVGGRSAVLRIGGARVILTEKRKPFHLRADFLRLGIDPLEHTVTVVKIGYLEPELKAMARGHFLVLSPGAVHPAPTSLPYRHRTRPLFPFEQDFAWEPGAIPNVSTWHEK